jgi:PAS domain S-box-containing protein
MPQRIFDRKIIFVITLLIALFGADAWQAFYNIRQLYREGLWVSHTHDVIETLQSVVNAVVQAETAQRGYILTGETGFLTLYKGSLLPLEDDLSHLAYLTVDNPIQQSRIPALRSAVDNRLKTLDENLNINSDKTETSGKRTLRLGRGQMQMEILKTLVAEMIRSERALLHNRANHTQRIYATALASCLLGSAICLAALFALLWIIRTYWQARDKTTSMIFEERELFRITLASIADAVITTDITGLVTFLNPVAELLTGWQLPDAKGKPLEKIFHIVNQETGKRVESPVAKVLQDGQPVGLANHTVLVSKEGIHRPIDDSAAPIKDSRGEIKGVVLIFRDDTDAKQAEEDLRQSELRYRHLAEELANSNRELEQFAYVASHDLQEPLHVINSFADLLSRRTEGKLSPKESEYIAFIRQAGTHAKTLVKELLEFSRIGKKGSIGPVDLNQVLKEVKSNLQIAIEQSQAELTYEELPVVQSVRSEVLQLFQNLLSNAIKYCQPDVHPRVVITWSRLQNMYLFSVEDNGIGIEPQYKDRIFEMFQRLHTKTESSGTGIGLAICKKIVEHYGGKIWLESETGKGTIFYFTLKAA